MSSRHTAASRRTTSTEHVAEAGTQFFELGFQGSVASCGGELNERHRASKSCLHCRAGLAPCDPSAARSLEIAISVEANDSGRWKRHAGGIGNTNAPTQIWAGALEEVMAR